MVLFKLEQRAENQDWHENVEWKKLIPDIDFLINSKRLIMDFF